MLIQIRKSGGEECKGCGATELLFSPVLNEHFERDLLEHFRQETRWWQWLKRRRFAHFAREVERVAEELRDKTRYPIS